MGKITSNHGNQTSNTVPNSQELQPENPPSQEQIKTLQVMVMAKSKENQEKEREILHQKQELERLQKELNKKSEDKQPYENFEASIIRRLSIYNPTELDNSLRVLNKIKNEIEPLIPDNIKNTIGGLRGSKFNSGTRLLCLEYNSDSCTITQNIYHFNAKEKCTKLHLCVLCVKLYEVGMCHAAITCPTIKLIDKNI